MRWQNVVPPEFVLKSCTKIKAFLIRTKQIAKKCAICTILSYYCALLFYLFAPK